MTKSNQEAQAVEQLHCTVGPALDGTMLAIVSRGGHPQIPHSGHCEVLTFETVSGWGRKKIDGWFKRMCEEKPWETRQ